MGGDEQDVGLHHRDVAQDAVERRIEQLAEAPGLHVQPEDDEQVGLDALVAGPGDGVTDNSPS